MHPIHARSTFSLLGLATLLAAATPAYADAAPACTLAKGQQRIEQERYAEAIKVFTCVIDAGPQTLDAYRGRAEAELLLGRYSNAMRDYARVTAVVIPLQPDADAQIWASYDARLAEHPDDIAALTGATFAHWWYFDHETTLPLLDRLLARRPNDLFGILYRGSNRLFTRTNVAGGVADFERAIQLAPLSADVRFIIADGYTYAYPDPTRARAEATLALQRGLDTPRVHAILASAAFALGDNATGAFHVQEHIELVTSEISIQPALVSGAAIALQLVPGRTFELPIDAVAGQSLSIRTESPSGAIYDSIAVLTAPDGSPAVGNDDFDIDSYLAGFDWVPPTTGRYTLRVTSFEGVSTGDLVVRRLP